MSAHLLAVVVGIPLAWHVGLGAYAFFDAGRHGMSPRKWALVSLLVPLFGFFAYLFERGEQYYDPEEDPYAGGGYNVHESRADEERVERSGSAGGRDRRQVGDGDHGNHGRER